MVKDTFHFATIVILIDPSLKKINKILLAMKKRGFGKGKWNGVGGKLKGGESIKECASRETKEEIGVDVINLKQIADLQFSFPANSEWNQRVIVYFCDKWTGDPIESEEMAPKWFKIEDIPYESMWPDDKDWVPLVLDGFKVKGEYMFGENDVIIKKKIDKVSSFLKDES